MKIITRVVVHIAFCMLVLIMAFALHGCDAPQYTWRGLPPGVTVHCGGFDRQSDIATCVGDNSLVYTCVMSTQRRIVSCAPRTPVQMPAESPR